MDFALRATAAVDAPSARVFAVITDIDRLPEWNAEITRVVERPPALEPGVEWVVEMRAFRTRWHSRSEVVELDPAAGRFAYRSRSDDGNPSYADWQWLVTPEGGGSRVEVSVSAHPRSFLRRVLISRVRPGPLRHAMERSLAGLAEAITEAERPEGDRPVG